MRNINSTEKNIYSYDLIGNSLKKFENLIVLCNAKNIDEANDWAKNYLPNIRMVDYLGMDVKIANVYNNHLKQLFEKYPQISFNYFGTVNGFYKIYRNEAIFKNKELLDYYKNPDIPEEYRDKYKKVCKKLLRNTLRDYGFPFSAYAECVGHDRREHEGIWINQILHKSYDSLLEKIKDRVLIKKFPDHTECIESIITHEFAHKIEEYLRNKSKVTFIDIIWASLKEKHGRGLKKYIKDNLGSYAAENKSDFFAEAIVEYMHSPNPRQLAMFVGQELERVLKQNK